MHAKRLAPLFLLLIAATAIQSQTPSLPSAVPSAAGFSQAGLERMHKALRSKVDDGKHAGYVSLLARDGQIIDWRAYGCQDIQSKAPMTKDSIVRVYSMSKLITSTAALILLEEGRLKLSDRVDQYLPVLKNPKVFAGGTAQSPILVDARQPVTIHQLLTHTSGYYYDFDADEVPLALMAKAEIWNAATLDEFVAHIAKLPLHEQPGTRFHYGLSTDILGSVIEKVSGQSLDQFLQQRILGPLGMKDTGFTVPADKLGRLARIHTVNRDGKLMLDPDTNGRNPGRVLPFPSGGGGLFSTAADYFRFAQMLLNGGQLEGVRILSRKTVELMTQNHLSGLAKPYTHFSEAQGFGLGPGILVDLGKSRVLGSTGQFGWDGMATTKVQIDPKEHTVAILLVQHVPTNQGDIFTPFINGYYSALE